MNTIAIQSGQPANDCADGIRSSEAGESAQNEKNTNTVNTAVDVNTPAQKVATDAEKQTRSTIKKTINNTGSVLSVISGIRYYRRAFARTSKDMTLPHLRTTIAVAKSELKNQRQPAQYAEAEELDPAVINRSLMCHIAILLIVGTGAVLAALATAHGAGLLLRHGQFIPQGNYQIITGPLFLVYAATRIYVSWKSACFFFHAKKTLQHRRPQNA